MNLNTVRFAAGAAIVGVALINHRKTVRTEREKRRVIVENFQKDMNALAIASRTLNEKIVEGEYRTSSIDDIMADFKFYQMINRED